MSSKSMVTNMKKIEDMMQMLSYRTLVRHAVSLGLPGTLKKREYVELLKLYKLGFVDECQNLARIMKAKKQTMKKSIPKKLVKKRSVGRPRKSKIKEEPLSDSSSENIIVRHTPVAPKIPIGKVQIRKTAKPLLKSNSEVQICSSTSVENIVYQRPIAKTTSELLRNMLLSTDRNRFNRSTSTSFTTTNNSSYFNYYQYDGSEPFNIEFSHHNSTDLNSSKWINNSKNCNIVMNEMRSTISGINHLPDLQAFPDIPQLADVDISASSELDNSIYSINSQIDTETMLRIDDSDTLSNESAENTEQEQRDFDQRWAMSVRNENGEITTPQINCETFNHFDDGSLLGPQDSVLVQNDIIQNYIETNDVQFMQLPDSSCEVIRTLQYYESRLLTNQWSFPEHLQNFNESSINEQIEQDNQLNLPETDNNTLAEFANMLPCPIAGCLWYSHSSTLYAHLTTYHQDMIFYGNSITHVFRCQDIQNYCFFTHLQYVQNTIFIITITFDSYSHTFVATIQHVSSCGDNTSASQTIAVLSTTTSDFLHTNNIDQHSWTGPVQPYSVPLDVLHADGRCLFIDPNNPDHVVIKVNLTTPLMYSNDSMFACL